MADDTLAGDQGLVRDDAAHHGGKGFLNLIRVLVSQAGSQGPLRVDISQQDTFAHPGKTDAQADCRNGLADAAFLVADSHDFSWFYHFFSSLFVDIRSSPFLMGASGLPFYSHGSGTSHQAVLQPRAPGRRRPDRG